MIATAENDNTQHFSTENYSKKIHFSITKSD